MFLSAFMFCQLDSYHVMLLLWHTSPLVVRAVTMSCYAAASRFLLFVGLWQKNFFQIGLVKSAHHHPLFLHTTDSLLMHVLLQHIKHILGKSFKVWTATDATWSNHCNQKTWPWYSGKPLQSRSLQHFLCELFSPYADVPPLCILFTIYCSVISRI